VKKNGHSFGGVSDAGFSVRSSTTPTWSSGAGSSISAPYVANPVGWFMMNRWWEVDALNQPGGDVVVRSYFTSNDISDLNGSIAGTAYDIRIPQMKFAKINGSVHNPDPATGHVGVPAASSYSADGYWEYNNGPAASTTTWRLDSLGTGGPYVAEYVIAKFSGGGGGGAPGGGNSNPAFPVEWLDFSAMAVGNDVQLDWLTASEQNNDYFVVERSTDGHMFELIGQVDAVGKPLCLYRRRLRQEPSPPLLSPQAGGHGWPIQPLECGGSGLWPRPPTDGLSQPDPRRTARAQQCPPRSA
jgi:hypothetical protein